MRESKLYKAIIQLSGHELNRLHRFILSPYFNRNDSLINLFELIKSDLKEETKEPISKVRDQAIQISLLRLLITLLVKCRM